MKTFEIWMTGYMATGEHGLAHMVTRKGEDYSTFNADTFKEACKIAIMQYSNEWERYYDEENNTFWACSLHDNEKDARKAFG